LLSSNGRRIPRDGNVSVNLLFLLRCAGIGMAESGKTGEYRCQCQP